MLVLLVFEICEIYAIMPKSEKSCPSKMRKNESTSRLDYKNALLSGCGSNSIESLQLIQNAAAHALTRTKKYVHISPVLASLHWLPVESRIGFKVLLLTYKTLDSLALYLKELVVLHMARFAAVVGQLCTDIASCHPTCMAKTPHAPSQPTEPNITHLKFPTSIKLGYRQRTLYC